MRGGLLLSMLLFVDGARAGCARFPPQPANGPGGTRYPHASAIVIEGAYGRKLTERYFIYLPASPTKRSAPLILYLHGSTGQLGGNFPYRDMLTHFARKGFLVVYVLYGPVLTPQEYESNTVLALRHAMQALQKGTGTQPELNRVVYAGHSLGGLIATRLAQNFRTLGVPEPSGLILHEPGGIGSPAEKDLAIDDLSTVRAFLLILATDYSLTGLDPGNGPTVSATIRRVWDKTGHLDGKRVIWMLQTDPHGCVPLIADHFAPIVVPEFVGTRSSPLDSMDWYGFWKPSEAALFYSLYGSLGDYLFPRFAKARFMGIWTDGKPVKPMVVPEGYHP